MDNATDTLCISYEEQLNAAHYRAERDMAMQELQTMYTLNRDLQDSHRDAFERLVEAKQKAERLGKLVWRLQNRLAKAHRRQKALRKGMRMWREKAISGPVHTVSAYDLLPEADLETLRWVREQGGLDALKAYTDCFSNLLRECHGYRDLARDYEKRLMPEGYEWPRFDDGELVRIGDAFDCAGKTLYVDSVQLLKKETHLWATNGTVTTAPPDERVKRQAVLAADGEPLEVGQTVWNIEDGTKLYVYDIDPKWGVGVSWLDDDGEEDTAFIDPGLLTHTNPEPDSWEQIEKDAGLKPRGYVDLVLGWDMSKDHSENQARSAMTHDLVRRAKALAERGE